MTVTVKRKNKNEVEKELLFTLPDADETVEDHEYWIPKTVPANLALVYLKAVAERGDVVAAWLMIEALLGSDAVDALIASDDLTEDDLNSILEVVSNKAMGATEKSLGK